MADPEVAAEIARRVAEIMPQARAEAYKCWQRAPHALELDELHAIALTGLAQAASRWERYCAERGHNPRAYEFVSAYFLARMRGAMLDYLRAQDWVTRSDRTRAKAIRDAGQDRGMSEAGLSAATGLTVTEIRDTLAAVSARPVSLEAESCGVADPGDVESQAVVSQVLGAARAVADRLPARVQVLLALRYYAGRTTAQAAAALEMTPKKAARLHAEAVLAVHDAMIAAVA